MSDNVRKILACLYQRSLFILSREDHVLVYWPEEDCTTVLYIGSVVDPSPPVLGLPCTVRIGSGRSYHGVMAGIGMLRTMINTQYYILRTNVREMSIAYIRQ